MEGNVHRFDNETAKANKPTYLGFKCISAVVVHLIAGTVGRKRHATTDLLYFNLFPAQIAKQLLLRGGPASDWSVPHPTAA